MTPNQSHVAGLELALDALQDAHLWVGSAAVRKLIEQAKAAPAEVPYALRQWAMDDEPESTLFDEGYNAARRWVKMQLEKPAEPTGAVEVVGGLCPVCEVGTLHRLQYQRCSSCESDIADADDLRANKLAYQHNRLMAAKDGDVVKVPRELRPVLAMILNALDRDAAEGRQARGEMAEELRALLGGAG